MIYITSTATVYDSKNPCEEKENKNTKFKFKKKNVQKLQGKTVGF